MQVYYLSDYLYLLLFLNPIVKHMKSLYLVLLFALTCTCQSFSQDIKSKDTITIISSGMGGIHLYQHSRNLNMDTLTQILKPNAEAYSFLKKAKTNNVFAEIFSYTGAFAIGFELGTALGGKSINLGVLGASVGLIGVAIPFNVGTKKNIRKAVSIYNTSLN
jgi:hypothetical protein